MLQVDVVFSMLSFLFACVLYNNLTIDNLLFKDLLYPLIILVLFRLQGFLFTRSYAGIIRYTSTQDAIKIFLAVTISSIAIIFTNFLIAYNTGNDLFPIPVIVIDYFICLAILTSFRIGLKVIHSELEKRENKGKRIFIYGSAEEGLLTKRSIETNSKNNKMVVAIVDNIKKLQGKSAEGVKIYHVDSLEELVEKYAPDEVVIAKDKIRSTEKKNLIERCLKMKLHVKTVPPVEKWIDGEPDVNQIKKVRIVDLLERDPIQLDDAQINKSLRGKVIMITGAAGSIGSEIARQCLRFDPKKIILFDQAETPLHDINYELRNSAEKIEVVIGDVCNKARVEKVFNLLKPEMVFHAAAYKHVPMMEHNPYEAINTNIFGTRIVASLSVKYGVKRFVYVSTDKAVNPTNIMGASKRIGEIYVQSLNSKLDLLNEGHTKFITTRFGNVLGSNGSVIPLFNKQIQQGGPVTVTHPEITRYFMTIPEACQLVLEAGSMGNGGEIYIFDMGQSVKIVDLAKKMIRLSGFEVNKDIDIVYSGLRPGEKLKEELLSDQENTVGTHHPKIMVAQVKQYNFLEVESMVNELYNSKDKLTNRLLVTIMKKIVPEYISNNSIYEELDKPLVDF
jgi:FlaA1/EpsC-like NDP-sugar epimerase